MMKNMFTPLSNAELNRLDDFLVNRLENDDAEEGQDEGVLDMSELDGLLTAVISAPDVIPPSQWLPAVWGDFEPTWKAAGEFEEIFSLMVRHMNSIAAVLMEQADEFEPLFLEQDVKGKLYTVVDEWCCGYMRGVDLKAESWGMATEVMDIYMTPIIAFATESGWAALDKLSGEEVESMQQAIAPAVRQIHAYWLAQRQTAGDSRISEKTVMHTEQRVGRNDPCPCGSGKKYKKCCLH